MTTDLLIEVCQDTIGSGESVDLEWHNSSLVGTTVSNMSEADIEMQCSIIWKWVKVNTCLKFQ